MAKLFLYILILFSATAVQAQSYDSWNIYHNRKEVSKFNNKKETTDERKVVVAKPIFGRTRLFYY